MTNGRHTLTIKELPADERPRERLLKYGPEALSDSELLAIILRVGAAEYSAVGLAQKMLVDLNGLRGIATASLGDFEQIHGIGKAKSAQIMAMVELGKRLAASVAENRPVIRNPGDAADLLMPSMRDLTQEHFTGLFLNTRSEVIKTESITVGTLDSSLISPRDLFRKALGWGSASVIVAHNHPSGDPTPSQEDITVTKRLVQAGEYVGVAVLDHVIIGDGRWVSLKERGLM